MISWHCTHRGCQASAESDKGLQNKRLKNKAHNHNPKSDEFFLSSKINHGIERRLSQNPTERTQKAVDVVIQNIPTEALEGFELRRFSFVAKRKKLSKKPPQPKTDSLLSAAWTEIMNGSTVVEGGELVQDVKDDIVMLGSKESLQLLQQNNFQVFGDGTFKMHQKDTFKCTPSTY